VHKDYIVRKEVLEVINLVSEEEQIEPTDNNNFSITDKTNEKDI
jgi:hypothetical protein